MAEKKNDSFAADQKRIADENAEQVARTDKMRPTPTQEENDRAKLGVESLEELDNKEPDGSPEEDRSAMRYETRDAAADTRAPAASPKK